MSGLEALGAPQEQIVTVSDGKQFAVRGLGLDAILVVFGRHRGELSDLFDRLVAKGDGGPALSLDQASELGGALLTGLPEVAAEIIAAGAGPVSEATIALARSLPFPVQIDALDKIAALTFTTEMPPKKVIEIVSRALGGVANTVTKLSGPAA